MIAQDPGLAGTFALAFVCLACYVLLHVVRSTLARTLIVGVAVVAACLAVDRFVSLL